MLPPGRLACLVLVAALLLSPLTSANLQEAFQALGTLLCGAYHLLTAEVQPPLLCGLVVRLLHWTTAPGSLTPDLQCLAHHQAYIRQTKILVDRMGEKRKRKTQQSL